VQEALADPLGLGEGELARQAEQRAPAQDDLRDQRDLKPRLVVLEGGEGQAAHAGFLADAIRVGKAGKPNEFGYVAQVCEVTPNTKPGARGLRLASGQWGRQPGENTLLPGTAAELQGLGWRHGRWRDGGFGHRRSEEQLAEIEPGRVFVSGRQEPGSARTKRRLRRCRTGIEGRISHLKRGYGLRRSRLKGQRTWTAWAVLAYDLDTFTVLPR
jgi:IS5 family transposase